MDAQVHTEAEVGAEEQAVEMEERALSMPEQARALEITDAESFERAGEFLVGVKTLRKEIEDHHQPMIESAHRAHKAALAAKKRVDDPLAEAERIVKRSISSYQAEEERKRRAEEARLREKAKKLEEEQRLEAAEKLEAEGKNEQADALLDRPPVSPPVISVQPEKKKVAGVKTRKAWKFRITDEAAIPREYLVVDQKRIRGVVQALGDQARIPGVEVYQETIVSAGVRS